VSTLGLIAYHRGFFEEEGMAVETLVSTNAKMSNDMLLARQGDLTIGGGPPFNFVSYNDHPLRIYAQTQVAHDTAVFARRDRGIVTEADLTGKKIGYLPGTVSFVYWAMLMERNGRSLSDYTMIPLQPPSMPAALVGGSVDAFVMWEPWGYNAMSQLKDDGVRIGDGGEYSWVGFLYGHKDYVKEHPQTIPGVLRALIKAERFLFDHKDESLKLVADYIKEDLEHLKRRWSVYNFRVKLDDDLIQSFLLNARYIRKFLPEFANLPDPEFRRFVDTAPLREVAPERVTLK
jgi:NitT/TauT family transport system substrate-binding protein